MVQLRAILLSSVAILSTGYASSVKILSPSNFDDVVFSGVPSLVEFFAPWCGHCKKLAPIYEELAEGYATSKTVNIASVDGDEHKDLSVKYGIQGFPTIKYFDGKSKDPVDYQGGRDMASFQEFISTKTGSKSKKKITAPSSVEMLTDGSFSGAVGGDKDVLVAFTAPWCGHCKTLAPVWEKVAEDFSEEPSIIIAKVDAEVNKAIAQQHGVTGYPTIKFFPKGSATPVDYAGGRDENSFVTYINEKAGTHRSIGGGLDAMGGTIEALDSIISKFTGSNLALVTDDVKAAAVGLKDKYADYYTKVLAKLVDNEGYVQKELTRLEGLLKKGGLGRSKLDDLTSRVNILRKFGLTGSKDEL